MRSWRSATSARAPTVLVVPRLDQWLEASRTWPGVVEKWVESGRTERLDPDRYASTLVFGQSVGSAPFSRYFESPIEPNSVWIELDFVRLKPDLNAVWLSPSEQLPDERSLQAIQALLAEHNMNLEVHSGRAYAQLASEPCVSFTAMSQTIGISLDHVMPQGKDRSVFVRLINDSQILFHDLEKQGAQPNAQGIWFSGLGTLPSPTSHRSRFSRLVASSLTFQGLAKWLGLEVVSAPLDVAIEAGDLVEWSGEEALDAQDNLNLLGKCLESLAWRLRFGRLGLVGLASPTRAMYRSTGDCWTWNR